MSTFSHSLHLVSIEHSESAKELREQDRELAVQPGVIPRPEDHGLGCMRGLAFAMAFQALLISLFVAGWELWRHLR